MRNPFRNTKKSKSWNKLLELDAWIDSSIFGIFRWFGEIWENITIFFRRFKVTGYKKFFVEIIDESITLGIVGLIVLLMLALPAIETTKSDWRNQGDFSVTFLDRNGKEIGFRGIRQTTVDELDQLPDHFIKAVLATEDRRFFDHVGLDFLGLFRALAENVKANSVVQGGSTITQQLAKNIFLTNERTLDRKIKEAFISLWLEINLDKQEILKLYLERAYMGGGNFGIIAAADYYFGKNIKDISLAEAAMLAGLYKAPGKYAPHINLPAARARANEVLTNIVQAGFMTEGQVIRARREPASVVERDDIHGPNYFMDKAFEDVKLIGRKYKSKNLLVKTTVDLGLQKAAEEVVESHLRRYGSQYGVKEAAMVVIDHEGAVRAIVGGRDYGESQFNRATKSVRQPGSSFKPFVYASSIDNFGYNEKTKVTDGSVCLTRFGKTWCPRNYAGRFRGRTDFTTALVKSINTIPVKLYLGRDNLQALGGERLLKTVRALGIQSKMTTAPPVVLGASGVSVIDMASAYGTFMSGGYRLDKYTISQIHDQKGTLLFDIKEVNKKRTRVLKEDTVQAMNRMLVQIPEWGTAKRAKLKRATAAGKTGTTQSYRDAWFVGFTGNYVAAVWYGNDNYQSTRRLTGGRLPAMTWKQFMDYAHQGVELRPIPFITKEKKKKKEQPKTAEAADDVTDQLKVRPKQLSAQAEKTLRDLETKLRNAKPLIYKDKLAGNTSSQINTQ